MSLYITDITTHQEAIKAVEMGAWAIGVKFDTKNIIHSENVRSWLHGFDFRPLKSGQFTSGDYGEIEELVTFCNLDMIHLSNLDLLQVFQRYSSRIIFETSFAELSKMSSLELDTINQGADGLILNQDSNIKNLDREFNLCLPVFIRTTEQEKFDSYNNYAGICLDYQYLHK